MYVCGPDFGPGELRAERSEPCVIQLDGAALEKLPCACVVRPGLDREVDVSDWDLVFELVV